LTKISGPRPNTPDDVTFGYYWSDDATCATAPTNCLHRKGDLYTVTRSAGIPLVTTYLKYDGAGRPLRVSDPNGVPTDFTYSARGWLTQVAVRGLVDTSTTDDAITTIAYEPTGTVSKVTQPDGDYLKYTYDAAHRLTDVADNLGRSIHYTLDAAGNRTKEDSKNRTGVLKHTLSRVYDQLGRVQKTLNAASQETIIAYDANDNVDLVSDPLIHTTDQDVDALNRPTQTTQDVGGLAVLTKYQYNALDQVTQVTDPKDLNTSYAYNGFGELITQTSPDTGTTSYAYDNAGNRITQVDARLITTSYGYDALNRLTSVTYPTAALNVAYTYDTANAVCAAGETYGKGRLSKFTDSTGNTQFCYDRFGNLTRKVQVNGALTQTTRFEYTLGGRLYRVTYPSGAQALYTRNSSDQISGVQLNIGGVTSTLVSSVNYMPFGPMNVITFGNGRSQTSFYDQDYNFGYSFDTATGGLNMTATPDAIGNIKMLVSTLNGAATTRNYSYNGLNRLTSATTPGTTSLDERFTYEGTGDRLSKQIGTGIEETYTYADDSHRLSAVAGVARTYNAIGSTLTAGSGAGAQTFAYDDRGRMIQSKLAGVVYRNYSYNARGERVGRIDPATSANTTNFIYDESGHLLGDYSSTGIALHEYVWLDNTLVGVIAPSEGSAAKFEYVETDQVGTPRVVIDPIRNVAIWRWSVTGSAFGEHAPDQDADGNGTSWGFALRYPGQYADSAALPYYNYLRDYEAGTGRYEESDPIGLGGGISTYAYVGSNPARAIDRFGLKLCRVTLKNMGANARTYLDDGFYPAVKKWLGLNEADGITVQINRTFRTSDDQAHLGAGAITPARPGHSLHEAGWAIDINWVNGLTVDERAIVLANATAVGLKWGGNTFRKPDRPHFYQDPGGREDLIKRAQQDFADGSAAECECDGGNYGYTPFYPFQEFSYPPGL
jgi:RHS repeat-associated protein